MTGSRMFSHLVTNLLYLFIHLFIQHIFFQALFDIQHYLQIIQQKSLRESFPLRNSVQRRIDLQIIKKKVLESTEEPCICPQGNCSKLQKTGQLNTIKIYCLTVLKARSPKSRCQPGHALLKPTGESFLFSYLQQFSGNLWHSLACVCITLTLSIHITFSLCVCLHMVISYKDISHIAQGPTPSSMTLFLFS